MKPLIYLPALVNLLALAGRAPGEILERVIAKVDGDIITMTDFESRQIAAVQAARISADRIEAFLRENNARILQDAIDELLLLHRAYELGLRRNPEHMKEYVKEVLETSALPI